MIERSSWWRRALLWFCGRGFHIRTRQFEQGRALVEHCRSCGEVVRRSVR